MRELFPVDVESSEWMGRAPAIGGLGRKEAIDPMTTTKQIPRQQWTEYFDRFTKKYLRDDRPETATIELLSPTLGDQFEVEGVRLLGVSYDRKSDVLEVLLKNMDHLVFQPKEISAIEEGDGFLSGIEIVRGDGTKEVLTIRRGEATELAPSKASTSTPKSSRNPKT